LFSEIFEEMGLNCAVCCAILGTGKGSRSVSGVMRRKDLGDLKDEPATAMQQGLLLQSTLADRPWVNLEQIVIEGSGPEFVPEALRNAWRRVAQRHDALRMLLVPDGSGGILQRVLPAADVMMTVLDLSRLKPDAQTQAVDDFLAKDRAAGVDLAMRPGWRVGVLQLSASRVVMVWTIHHALIDGASMAIVLEDLGLCLTGQPLPTNQGQSFAAFSAALQHHDKAEAKAFFSRMFVDGVEHAPLVRRQAQAGRQALQAAELSLQQSTALRDRVRALGATPLNAVQAAWALVLARWTGQEHATFGLVESGRSLMPGLQRTVGCLISTLPFHLRLHGKETLADLLPRLRALTLDMRPHAHASLTEVRRWIGASGADGLFDSIVMYEHASLSARMRSLGGLWAGCSVRLIEEGASAVTLAIADDPQLRVVIEHDPARVTPEEAQALLRHVTNLLAAMAAADPATPLADLVMLSPEEVQEVLALGQPDAPQSAPLADVARRFEAVAAIQPEVVALMDPAQGVTLDYRRLDRAANAFAAHLHGSGVKPGDIVGLHLARGAAHVTALLAILKLGAAFLPLDPSLPVAWLADRRQQAGARVLVSDDGAGLGADLVLAPDLNDQREAPPDRPPPDASRLAYVLFTSGSTGAPKGVRGLCGALSAHGSAAIAAYGLRPGDRVMQFAGLGFDVALEEIFPTLLAGASLVLRDAGAANSLRGFAEFVAEHKVTVANLPAGFWHAMVEGLGESGLRLPPSLRLVIAGSERINPLALRRWRSLVPDVTWMNGYGPTETTITATAFSLPPGQPLPDDLDEVPIGRPLAHARAVLRAFDGSLTPKGGTGILWIGGAAVTGGYLGDADAAQAAFQPDPWQGDGRLYCTGDQARWRADGQLEFLGRRDRQIKLRGHRIDLHQLEAQLVLLPAVRQAHVALVTQSAPRLVAWVVIESGTTLQAITEKVVQSLPAAMVPHLVAMESLPLSANGKIDTRALPIPELDSDPAGEGPAADTLTQLVADCMAEVLGLPFVPPDARFSDLGGDSLLALRLVSLIEQRSGHALLTANLHQHNSPRALALMLQTGLTAPRYTIPIQPHGTKPPFFAIHVLGRNEDLFRPLSTALGPDQPLLGLSVGMPRNLDDINVERTARIYFDEIQTYYPTGPIGLGAVSMAAYFAFELAQLLHAAGREVRVLAVLDAMGPDGRPALTGAAKMRAHLQQVRKHGLWHFARVIKNRLDRHRERREALRTAPDQVNAHNLIAANVCAVEFYQPKPYDGPLTVFRADHSFWDSPEALQTALGWASVARGGLAMHDLPGTHLSILHPGNVEVLADHLRRLMADKPV
jgi:amino acid adenylation domain-containing protein